MALDGFVEQHKESVSRGGGSEKETINNDFVFPRTHRFGTMATFVTLVVAICVNGVRACVFHFESNSNLDLECNNMKNTWTVTEDVKGSSNRKILTLAPEQDGCMKTKDAIILNSTRKVTLRFFRDAPKDDAGKVILRLIPKEGLCPEEECVWDVTSDSQNRAGEWVTAEHKFPVKSMKDYFVQLQLIKSKGKFLMDHISIPSVTKGDSKRSLGIGTEINLPQKLTGEDGSKSTAPWFAEISKNLMLTSASVLVLDILLN